ncbi:MAG: YdcH family protein [Alphaproteobacteria bacterium]
MTSQAINAPTTAKIKALRAKHAALENRIDEAMKSPAEASAEYYLKQLKRQKLVLKDHIEHLERSSANH